VTVHIGDAHPGDIVAITAERLADPWMQGQIAAGNLVLHAGNARVSAEEQAEADEDVPVSQQEPPGDAETVEEDGTPPRPQRVTEQAEVPGPGIGPARAGCHRPRCTGTNL
jgi:hypothetical protein